MDKLMNFLMIIAWVGAILSTIGFAICAYSNLTYPNSQQELFDRLQGIKKEWPTGMYLTIAVICWAFIFSFK